VPRTNSTATTVNHLFSSIIGTPASASALKNVHAHQNTSGKATQSMDANALSTRPALSTDILMKIVADVSADPSCHPGYRQDKTTFACVRVEK
jgi:hypothetical protein